MVFVIAGHLDVVPRGRLVAKVTLIDFGMWLTGDLGRNHLKMHHVMAWWTLMALSTIGRACRWMPELWNRPLRRRVALGTILAEELDVPILVRMASCTIQDCLLRGLTRMGAGAVRYGLVLGDPIEEVSFHHFAFSV